MTGENQILAVNNKTEALRVGVQATVRLMPWLASGELARLGAAVTYRYAVETYTGRDLRWFQSDVRYNLDPGGYFAATFSYKRGDDEETGAYANVYKLGLSGKI